MHLLGGLNSMDPHVSGEFLFWFGLEGACYFEDELFMFAAVLGMFTSASKTCIADITLRNNFLIFFFINCENRFT